MISDTHCGEVTDVELGQKSTLNDTRAICSMNICMHFECFVLTDDIHLSSKISYIHTILEFPFTYL